jgi:hypothetical protein
MATKTTSAEVQQTINALRQQQLAAWDGLKEQWATTSQQLSPGRLVANAIGRAVHIPKLGSKIAAVAAGFAVQKIILPGRPWINLLGATSAFVLGGQLKKRIGNAQILGKIIIKKLVSSQKGKASN